MAITPKDPSKDQDPKPEPIDPPSDVPPVELPGELVGFLLKLDTLEQLMQAVWVMEFVLRCSESEASTA